MECFNCLDYWTIYKVNKGVAGGSEALDHHATHVQIAIYNKHRRCTDNVDAKVEFEIQSSCYSAYDILRRQQVEC